MLPRLVEAFARQQDVGPFEVIIVDNASPDESSEVLARLVCAASFPLTVIRQLTNRGPAAARNRGWRATAAPLA